MATDAVKTYPDQIGPYRLLDALGEGASSLVYRGCFADDPAHRVAVKISKALWNEADVENRVHFEQEADLLSRLTHPVIVRLLKLGVHGGRMYLVTELAAGETLGQIINARRALGVEEVAEILRQVATGLAHAHSRGVLHRDIKPSNIVVDFAGQGVAAKILDFGLGRLEEGRVRRNAIGTFLYMSPEQLGILPQNADERSDLYSLGIVAVELMAGRHPFAGQELRDLIHSHAAVIPAIPAGIPPGLAAIVSALVQKDPAKRYSEAALLEKDLGRFLENLRRGVADVFPLELRRPGLSLQTPGFTGRAESLATLARLYETARGGDFAVALVSGVSGFGKTRLIAEASHRWSRSIVLWAKGRAYGQTSAYGLAAEILRALAGEDLGEGLRARIRRAVGRRAGDVVRLVPELRDLLGEAGDAVDIDPARRQQRFLEAVLDLLAAIGTQAAPLVLGLDDIQWADEGSLGIFAQLAVRKSFPGLLVAGFRVDEIPEGSIAHEFLKTIARSPKVGRVELGPMTKPEVASLVESMLGESLPEVADAVASQAGGSPLFTVELVHALVEAGAIEGAAAGWRVAQPEKLNDPRYGDNLIQTIVTRIGRLSERDRRVLDLAAVVGRNFDFSGLASALALVEGVSEEAAAVHTNESLREAEKMRLVAPQSGLGNFSFSHDKVREALYDKLDSGLRMAYHRQVGLALEKDRAGKPEAVFALAHHYCRSGNPQKSIEFSVAAGDLALERHANREALEYYEHAKTELPRLTAGDRDRYERHLHESVGDTASMIGDYDRAMACYDEFLRMESEPLELVRVNTKIGRCLLSKGDATRAIPVLEKALSLLGEPVPQSLPTLLAHLVKEVVVQVWHNFRYPQTPISTDARHRLIGRLYNQLSRGYYLSAEKLKTVRLHLRHLNFMEAHNVPEEKAQAYSNHAVFCAEISWFSRGLLYARRGLAIRLELGDRWGAAQSRHMLILALFPLGEWEEIIREGRLAELEFEQLGDKWELAVLLVLVSVIYSFMGDWDQSEAHCEKAYRIGMETNQVAVMAYAIRTKAELGDRFPQSTLLSDIEELIPKCSEGGQWLALFQLVSSKGLVLRRWGRYKEAEEAFRQGIKLRVKNQLRFEATVNIYTDCADAVLSQAELADDPKERERLLASAGKLLFRGRLASRQYVNQWPRYLNARARWYWLNNRKKAAEKTWQEAHSLFLKKGSVWGQAMVLMDWATALQAKDPQRARPLLRTAWPLVARLGSKVDMERLQKFLPEAKTQGPQSTWSGSLSAAGSRNSHGEWVGAERLATLAEVSSKMSSTLDLDRLLQEVVTAAARIFGAERAFLFLMESPTDQLVRKAAFQPPEDEGHERPYSQSILAEVLRTGAGVACADAQTDNQLVGSESVAAAGILSLMCVPLQFQNKSLGALYLDNRLVKGLFGGEDLKLLEAFASQAAVALMNAQLFSAQDRSRQELALLYDTSKELIGVIDRRRIYSLLLARARTITNAGAAAVILFEEGLAKVRSQQHFGPGPLEEILNGLAAGNPREIQALTLSDSGVARIAPLMAQGKLEGVIVVGNLKEPERAGELLAHIAAQGTLALSNSRLHDLAVMAERLAELDRMKEDFISNVTHELRSPLSAIQSYVNLMTDDLREGRRENTMDHLTVVRNNATRLTKFVNDILDLAKIEAASGNLKVQPVNLADILKEVETLFKLKAQENHVVFAAPGLEPEVMALANESAVNQIITNLVSNALKFTPSGGRVELKAVRWVTPQSDPLLARNLPVSDRRQRYARVTVSDTGRGIESADLARIFDRFEQVKEARESTAGSKGTGLGLAISRGLAEAQGGRLLAESVPGQGSVFSLYLRVAP